MLFFAESFVTRASLAYYIMVDAFPRIAVNEMYAGIVAMSLLGLILYFLVDWTARTVDVCRGHCGEGEAGGVMMGCLTEL